jgi:hypothetical protein
MRQRRRANGTPAQPLAREVLDLTVGAQKRVAELVSERTQAAVTELKALTTFASEHTSRELP